MSVRNRMQVTQLERGQRMLWGLPDMRDPETMFSKDYANARDRFLRACRDADLDVVTRTHPMKGFADEDLAMDVVRLGPMNASNVIVVTSATHGVEGFGGSGIQLGLLREHGAWTQAKDTAVLLIHAVNPFGFSWLRRVNEDNIDLNRNFVDHLAGDYPENELFERLYPYAVPKVWSEESIAWCDRKIEELAKRYGSVEIRKAMTKGQYNHADSVHFGGLSRSWSNEMLQDVCDTALAEAKRAVLVDLHTGLGPYGYGELMTPSKPGEPVFDRLYAWFGEQVHSTTAGPSGYAGAKGSILAAFRPRVPRLEWTAVGLEFGTLDWKTVSHAMRADVWLHAYGEPLSDTGERIRAMVRNAFHIEEARWKTMIWERGREVVHTLVTALGNTSSQ